MNRSISLLFQEFVNCCSDAEYSQSCRGKNAVILDFFWVADTELVYVTDRGVEHYQASDTESECRELSLLPFVQSLTTYHIAPALDIGIVARHCGFSGYWTSLIVTLMTGQVDPDRNRFIVQFHFICLPGSLPPSDSAPPPPPHATAPGATIPAPAQVAEDIQHVL